MLDGLSLKDFLPLIYVTAGWLLSQANPLITQWRQNRRIKKALLKELETTQNRLLMSEYNCIRLLRLYSLNEIEGSNDTPITNPIYSNFYSEIAFQLNENQRASYDLIYGSLIALQKSNELNFELAIAYYKERNRRNFDNWGSAIKARFLSVRRLRWNIDYHLNNPKNPDFEDMYIQEHQGFREAETQSEKLLSELEEKAKNSDTDEFLKFYNESRFLGFSKNVQGIKKQKAQ